MSKRVILSAMGAVAALFLASAGSASAATPAAALNMGTPSDTSQVIQVNRRWWRHHFYYGYPGYYAYPGYAYRPYPYYGYRRYGWAGPGVGVYVGPRHYWW
jgi:hypothetical protein